MAMDVDKSDCFLISVALIWVLLLLLVLVVEEEVV